MAVNSDPKSSRARLSLPPFLQIKKSTIPKAKLGVFTCKELPINHQFGPYEGRVFKKSQITSDMDVTYQWEVSRGAY